MSGPTELPYNDIELDLGGRRLVGHKPIRDQLSKILISGRLSHAYLIAGPNGIGKKALALAFAEAINGIDHLSDLQGRGFSKKKTWSNHPDIKVFLPLPGSEPNVSELYARVALLANDPYEVVDFNLRPSLTEESSTSGRNSFYSIEYFRKHIRPSAYLKPNEGFRNIIIITEVERMRAEGSNAFLKLLEEPPPNLMFILTTDSINRLLPTITSRCQLIKCAPLTNSDIVDGLIRIDGAEKEDAEFLARISNGNYSITRFYDIKTLRETRDEIIAFLRHSYSMDATNIIKTSMKWQKDLNVEGQVGILNLLEIFIRDIALYQGTRSGDLLTNADQLQVISRFCETLGDARLDDMIAMIEPFRAMLRQNVSARLIFTVMANRFAYLMRGRDPFISEQDEWKHIPASRFT